MDTTKCDKCKARKICIVREAFSKNDLAGWTDKVIFRLTYCGYRIGRYGTTEDLDIERNT